jgi:hypothetical protein
MRKYEILQTFLKVNESLQKFMIFHEIFLVKSFTFVHLQCTLLTFAFVITDFFICLQNFGFAQTILKF